MNQDLEDQVEEFCVLKVKDVLKTGFKGKEDPMVTLTANNMLKQTKASSGIIWNSLKEVEGPELETILRDFPVPSFLIPFAKHFPASSSSLLEQDRTFFPWLDTQPPNSVLYVSFGSMVQVDEKDFLEIAHGLVDSKQPFLWAVRPGFVKGSAWLELLPDGFLGETGRVVKWAPQQEVLAHEATGGFWTHNGWNSTLESICEGVAMICSPIWGDQVLNARCVSEGLGVGVHLEYEWQREKIANAIRRVMVDDLDIRERARVLKDKVDVSLAKGHINPMLQLANILYSKGFSITILHTNFNSFYTSNYPHFTFRHVLDNDPKDANLSKLASKGIGDLLSGIMLLNQCSAAGFHQELNQMLIASKEPIVCLITDALWYFTQSVADGLNLPRLVLRTSSLFCVLVYASIPVLDDQGYFNQLRLSGRGTRFEHESVDLDLRNFISPIEESNSKKVENIESVRNLEERVSELPVLKAKDVLKMRIKGQGDPTAKLLANMLKQTKASSGIIWNSFKELEESELQKIHQDFPIPSFLIGPFHKYFPATLSSLQEPDRSSITWLDRQAPNSVLYISFGSAAQLEEQEFLEVAHGLATSNQPFLWVMRPGLVKGSEWLEMLPNGFLDEVGERGHIVKWAPQHEVLAHQATGAFWTHNGWNSTLESICEGVPMICSPFWGDQPLDARYVSDVLKVGVYLEDGWARDEIASAIRRVLVDEEREDIRERARCLKEKVNVSQTTLGPD
ncbi:hypothetical protein OSB04_028304 [Centaurea solstitialis]|uniref:UDP-glycosyltransferase n=1 Tax=Centaurea solstitialis TaxID=347529 RepID=A0AA38SG83_9ASTR|nr:hypothetical protein OSB04_028304 [Centaurea solstitialis]